MVEVTGLEVECPKCKAPKDVKCITPKGKPYKYGLHSHREAKAEEYINSITRECYKCREVYRNDDMLHDCLDVALTKIKGLESRIEDLESELRNMEGSSSHDPRTCPRCLGL